MARNDGGSAFPGENHTEFGLRNGYNMGMSLRDYFAGQASDPPKDWLDMQRMADKNRNPHNDYHKPRPRETVELIAAYKYMIADAMLAEREKGNV